MPLTLPIPRIDAGGVHRAIARSMLADGMPYVLDLDRSHGTRFVDKRTGRHYLDFFGFFASNTIGHSHPALMQEDFLRHMARIAVTNPSNSDIYTEEMAAFVETLGRAAQPPSLPHLFLISGGALAVENALKTAFDWKYQKRRDHGLPDDENLAIIHFRQAFHGRTGYTMSMTNTEPTKVRWFPKFDWPRITNPKVTFPIDDHLPAIEAAESAAIDEIRAVLQHQGDRIAGLIIEPIQGEGGDNHFRGEFLRALRRITLEHDVLFILDEIQTGVGATGAWWAYQHFGFEPDILCFGKKMQVCGIMASARIDDVDSVFKISSRINSTWGGSLVDMVRATRYLQVIETDNLLDNAARRGEQLLAGLWRLHHEHPSRVGNARGRGLLCAFSLPDRHLRDALLARLAELGLLALPCGSDSIRFRPPLTVTPEDVDEALDLLASALKAV